jgi:hypothetical protein
MPMDKLLFLVDQYISTEKSSITDVVLQDILDILIDKDTTEAVHLSPYINKIKEILTQTQKIIVPQIDTL